MPDIVAASENFAKNLAKFKREIPVLGSLSNNVTSLLDVSLTIY